MKVVRFLVAGFGLVVYSFWFLEAGNQTPETGSKRPLTCAQGLRNMARLTGGVTHGSILRELWQPTGRRSQVLQ